MIEPVEQVLYRFFDADGALLYVGISLDPGSRFRQHRAEKPWWSEVVNITLERHPDRDAVAAAEVRAIKTERPRYNLTHNANTLAGAERMAQMVARMADPPARYWSECPACRKRRLPSLLWQEVAGWFAVYDCCEEKVWTQDVAA